MTAILAALAGAGVAGFITHILALRRERQKDDRDERRTKQMEEREKMGLLKLVHSEITNNLEHLKRMGRNRWTDRDDADALRTETWEQSRNKLAELVEDEEHFEHLVACYGVLDVFKGKFLGTQVQDFESDPEYEAEVKSLINHHWLAYDACQQETGRFRAWSKGMLVYKPISELEPLEDEDRA